MFELIGIVTAIVVGYIAIGVVFTQLCCMILGRQRYLGAPGYQQYHGRVSVFCWPVGLGIGFVWVITKIIDFCIGVK